MVLKYLDFNTWQRFHNYIKKTSKCWLWIGSKDYDGYGQFMNYYTNHRAHRFSYQLYKGNIPKNLVIDHLCKNPSCVNPDHLEAVTNRENILRGISPAAINSKKTHCPKGHKLSGDNVYIYRNSRWCKKCRKYTQTGKNV